MNQYHKYLHRQGYRSNDFSRADEALRRIKDGEPLGNLALLADQLKIAEYVDQTGDGPEGLKDLMAF